MNFADSNRENIDATKCMSTIFTTFYDMLKWRAAFLRCLNTKGTFAGVRVITFNNAEF